MLQNIYFLKYTIKNVKCLHAFGNNDVTLHINTFTRDNGELGVKDLVIRMLVFISYG